MYIHNPLSAIIYRIICLIFCVYGIILSLSPFGLSHMIHMLSYFTILSNILCMLVFFACILVSIKSYRKNNLAVYSDLLIFLKGLSIVSILLSFIAFHYMLNQKGINMSPRGIMLIDGSDFFVHYFVPFITVSDWLLFCPKGKMRLTYPFLWVLYPCVYFVIIMIGYICGNSVPYFFMDIATHGKWVFFQYVFCIFIICLALGFIIVSLDLILKSRRRKLRKIKDQMR